MSLLRPKHNNTKNKEQLKSGPVQRLKKVLGPMILAFLTSCQASMPGQVGSSPVLEKADNAKHVLKIKEPTIEKDQSLDLLSMSYEEYKELFYRLEGEKRKELSGIITSLGEKLKSTYGCAILPHQETVVLEIDQVESKNDNVMMCSEDQKQSHPREAVQRAFLEAYISAIKLYPEIEKKDRMHDSVMTFDGKELHKRGVTNMVLEGLNNDLKKFNDSHYRSWPLYIFEAILEKNDFLMELTGLESYIYNSAHLDEYEDFPGWKIREITEAEVNGPHITQLREYYKGVLQSSTAGKDFYTLVYEPNVSISRFVTDGGLDTFYSQYGMGKDDLGYFWNELVFTSYLPSHHMKAPSPHMAYVIERGDVMRASTQMKDLSKVRPETLLKFTETHEFGHANVEKALEKIEHKFPFAMPKTIKEVGGMTDPALSVYHMHEFGAMIYELAGAETIEELAYAVYIVNHKAKTSDINNNYFLGMPFMMRHLEKPLREKGHRRFVGSYKYEELLQFFQDGDLTKQDVMEALDVGMKNWVRFYKMIEQS